MAAIPSAEVISAIESGVARVTRRLDIFEQDGETPWGDAEENRMIGGNVQIDYGRDERRTLDLEINNQFKLLSPTPGQFWYDKVLKLYRGVTYDADTRPPSIVIIEAESEVRAFDMAQMLVSLGYTRTTVNLTAYTYGEIAAYDFIVADMGSLKPGKWELLQQCYAVGKKIITTGATSTGVEIPMIAATVGCTVDYGIADPPPNRLRNPNYIWANETYVGSAQASGQIVSGMNANAEVAAYWSIASVQRIAALIGWNDSDGRWFHFQPPEIGPQAKTLFGGAMYWLRNFSPTKSWEVQTGEFVLDRIVENNFPNTVKVTGRDYTKRALLSKVTVSLTFASGTPLKTLVSALANNAGILKQRLANATEVLATDLSIERGTDRWSIMRDAANSFNYELYVDNEGYLTMSKFRDPTLDAIQAVFRTGPGGNLSTFEKSTNDSRLYNNIIVTGERSDGGLPYFGQAKNTQPDSPTSVDEIGDRVFPFSSTFFASDAQCLDYANTLLSVSALETYEMSCSSIVYPWLEGGSIVQILLPDMVPTDPTRYLCDTLNIPVQLGPMTFTGKRVTIVK